MGISNPFNVDAALASEQELAQLPPHGGAAVRAFCGLDTSAKDWAERGVCVLKARKGFGKSHLLAVRSSNHRSCSAAAQTLFYPQGGRPRILFDALSSLHVVVPRWLQGRESAAAWIHIWQLSILGLLVWITGARSATLRGYADWFGSLESLDQIRKLNRPDAPDGGQPSVMLTWFMGRILERMPLDDYNLGISELKQGLYHANSDWAIAITSSIASIDKTSIAMYLDAPDELVDLDPPNLWRNVQQGLLLAIWKFSKSAIWGRVLNIYASVRSEAFGSGQDHPDLALAMGLVMLLNYNRDDLESMLNDRIRQADPARFASPLLEGQRPIEALCGFRTVIHEDRSTSDGGRYTEDVFDSLLRHTRLVPREVIAIGGAIYDTGLRNFNTVRRAVNAQASLNISYAISHSFLGWNEASHGRFAAALRQEVIDRPSIEKIATEFGHDGPKILKFFVQHGLLGVAEPLPKRHRHYYQQRFAFDEVHGSEDSSSVNKDFFFVHPAFKEWILSLPEQLNNTFERLALGVVGDLKSFESKPPLLRLGFERGKIMLRLRTNRRMSTTEKGVASDPLKFLFLVLWACRELKQTRVNLTELKEVWQRLKNIELIKSALSIYLPTQIDSLAEKIRDWAKKINKDSDIRQLQQTLAIGTSRREVITTTKRRNILPRDSFISVSSRSNMGSQVEVWFPHLPINELDWDEPMYSLVGETSRAIPGIH
jgi:hypothetical protein